MKCMVIIFVKGVCMYVRRKKLDVISACDIIGVASHGKHTKHAKKLGN